MSPALFQDYQTMYIKLYEFNFKYGVALMTRGSQSGCHFPWEANIFKSPFMRFVFRFNGLRKVLFYF